MRRDRDDDFAAVDLDTMIRELLDRLDDAPADREPDFPEVEEIAAPYPWVKAWMPN